MCDKCDESTIRIFESAVRSATGRAQPSEPCKCAECRAKRQEAGRGLPQPTADDRMTPQLSRHLYTLMRRLNSCWSNLHKFAGDPTKHKHWLDERKLAQQRIDAVFDALAENYDKPLTQMQQPAPAKTVYLGGVPADEVRKIRGAIGAVVEAKLQVRACVNAGVKPPEEVLARDSAARRQLDNLLDEITLKNLPQS